MPGEEVDACTATHLGKDVQNFKISGNSRALGLRMPKAAVAGESPHDSFRLAERQRKRILKE